MEVCRHIFVNGNDCGFFKLTKLLDKYYWEYFQTKKDYPILHLKIRGTYPILPVNVSQRPNYIDFYEEDLK